MDGPVLSVPEAQLHIQGTRTREILTLYLPHYRNFPMCNRTSEVSGTGRPEMINALAFELFVGDDLDAET